MLSYNKDKIAFSREIRKNMTSCEKKLWYHYLRNYPVHIYRQKVIGEYIVDFYCAKARLVIEVDGGFHQSPQSVIEDNYRSRYLEDKGIYIFRVSNEDIESDFYETCERIDRAIQVRLYKNKTTL